MSVTSSGPGVGAGRAAASEAEAAHNVAAEEVVITSKKHCRFVRILLWCIPKPKSADGWTNLMAIGATIFIPVWFYLAHKWNPNYEPVRAPVWAVPWQVAFYWLGLQAMFLSVSIQKSTDEIRFREIFIAFLPLISCGMTLTGLVILWVVGFFNFDLFQWYEIWAFVSAALFNAFIGGGVRFALKGKIFGQLGPVNN